MIGEWEEQQDGGEGGGGRSRKGPVYRPKGGGEWAAWVSVREAGMI